MTTLAGAGTDIEVVEAGEGPTIGYLHGLFGTPAELPFIRALAATGHHVVAPNLPGFGGSQPRSCRDLLDWIGHLSRIVDDCGLTGAPLVAASVGAMVAVELAALRPEAFAELVLVSPFGLWCHEHPAHDFWSERTARQSEWLVNDPAAVDPFFASGLPDDSPDRIDEEIRRYRTRRAAASIMWPIPDRGLLERLYRLRCTTHLVWGADDRVLHVAAYSEAWAKALPRCGTVRVVDGAGHLAEWDAPDAVAAAVTSALRH